LQRLAFPLASFENGSWVSLVKVAFNLMHSVAHEFKVQCCNLKRLFIFLKGAIRASGSSQLGYDKVGTCTCIQAFILVV